MDRLEKNKNIAQTMRETYAKRKSQICKCFKFKIDKSNLSKQQANQLKNLAKEMNEGKINQSDESIKDTLIDLANYCILTYMEMERAEIECQCKEEDKK